MSKTIGLRVYVLRLTQKGDRSPITFEDPGLSQPVADFVSEFVTQNSTTVSDAVKERSWYFELPDKAKPRYVYGHVHYGTFGFEANLKDGATKALKYRRQRGDVEEIPLYFEFWFPENQPFGLAVFQSFQGRSCVTMVMDRLREAFEASNDGYALKYSKLLPTDSSGGIFSGAPVKKLRLIKRNASSDVTGIYSRSREPQMVDLEVTVSAKRRQDLGVFGEVSRSLKDHADGVIMYAGLEFPEAVADVQIGKKTRPVGIFGSNSNAGVIDVTADVEFGEDGHPTLDSMEAVTEDIAGEFYRILVGA